MGTPLSVDEIANLVIEVKKLNRHVLGIQNKNPVGKHLQLPKTPTILTESIVYYLVLKKKILPKLNSTELKFNEKSAKHEGTRKGNTDLIAIVKNKEYLIEVKGTRKPSQFTQFSEKDIQADCAIWVDYGNTFLENQSCIEVAVIENPKSAGLEAKKYTWTQKSFTDLKVPIKSFNSIKAMIK